VPTAYSARRLISAIKRDVNDGTIQSPIEIYPYDCSPGPRGGKGHRLLRFTPEENREFADLIRENDLWVSLRMTYQMNAAKSRMAKVVMRQVLDMLDWAQYLGVRAVLMDAGRNDNPMEAMETLQTLATVVSKKKYVPWFLLINMRGNAGCVGSIPLLLKEITAYGKTGVCVDLYNLVHFCGGLDEACAVMQSIKDPESRRLIACRTNTIGHATGSPLTPLEGERIMQSFGGAPLKRISLSYRATSGKPKQIV